MLGEDGYPIPVTNNDWSPIEFLKPEVMFPDDQEFLVWLKSSDGREFANVAQWTQEFDSEGRQFGEKCLTGEWRHIDTDIQFTPVAFKAIVGPDLDQLKFIVETYPGLKSAA